jgi:2-keto-4-pentenoate hydratase/2-oxohepta-3-ene-1,7-dioic acid hydratase in catechol pathway
MGKGLDRSCPMGPAILHRNFVADPTTLELTLSPASTQRSTR